MSQSKIVRALLFLKSSQGTDQGVGCFKDCLNRKNPSGALERLLPKRQSPSTNVSSLLS